MPDVTTGAVRHASGDCPSRLRGLSGSAEEPAETGHQAVRSLRARSFRGRARPDGLVATLLVRDPTRRGPRHDLGAAIPELAASWQVGIALPEVPAGCAGPRRAAGADVRVGVGLTPLASHGRVRGCRSGARARAWAGRVTRGPRSEVLPPWDPGSGPGVRLRPRLPRRWRAGAARCGRAPRRATRGAGRGAGDIGAGRCAAARPGHGRTLTRTSGGADRPGRVTRVPITPPDRVAQQQVGLLDGEEAFPLPRRRVRVISLGQPPMGGLDLLVRRPGGYAQLSIRVGGLSRAAHRPNAIPAPISVPSRSRPRPRR